MPVPETFEAAAPAPKDHTQPTTIVILGASGDLTRRLLFPALHRLIAGGDVALNTRIVGYAIEPWTTADFVAHLRQGVEEFGGGVDEQAWTVISANTTFVSGDLDPVHLHGLLDHVAANAVFYLALPPALFGPAASALANIGLADETSGFRRLVIEKPFGTDRTTCDALQAGLRSQWQEHQLFRIDHFLGKDTVQNLMVFRMANRFVEAVWNSASIAQVQITAAETLGLEGRWRYYDQAGALRDMLQNHLMQLFALCAMEPPTTWNGDTFRNHKVELLSAVRSINPGDMATAAIRGQYTADPSDPTVLGYREEPNIAPTSRTETYAALRLDVHTPRWQGVPFYLRSGKRLGGALTEIALQLRPVLVSLFGQDEQVEEPLWIVFQLRPDETITIEAIAKKAGLGLSTERIALDATDANATASADYSSYEQLLLDIIDGDASHFIRGDEASEAWRIVQPVLDSWAAGGEPLPYASKSDGPEPSAGFFVDGHAWRKVTS